MLQGMLFQVDVIPIPVKLAVLVIGQVCVCWVWRDLNLDSTRSCNVRKLHLFSCDFWIDAQEARLTGEKPFHVCARGEHESLGVAFFVNACI